MEAAGPFQIAAPPQHHLALGEARPGAVGRVLPARLVGVEEGALEFGPHGLRPAADRRRAHEAGVVAPGGEQALHEVGRHQHIAVGDDDPAVRGGAPAFGDVVELGVLRNALVADQQARRDVRVLGNQPLDQRHDGVAAAGAAEQDLVVAVVEFEGRAQRRFLEMVEAADRPDDADRRPVLEGVRARARHTAAPGCRQRRCELDGEDEGGDGGGEKGEGVHVTSASWIGVFTSASQTHVARV